MPINIEGLKRSGVRFHHYDSEVEALGGPLAAKKAEGDSGLVWWLFDAIEEREAARRLEHAGISVEPYRCHCEHDCCGCGFGSGVYFRAVGKRLLARASFGRNI